MIQSLRMKYLLIFVFALSAIGATAQRDINHVQVTLQPGLIYTNNNIGNNISENIDEFESDFYGTSLRIQKRLGKAFQIGLEYGEYRQWNNNDLSFRNTALSLGYAWDNGNLLSTRSFITPYHLVKVGSSVMQASSEPSFDESNFLVGTENGLKFRLGDRWSAQLSLDLFWMTDFESADKIFENDFNYGYQAGVSYHFGAVKTNYQAPVFNAGRQYNAAPADTSKSKATPRGKPEPEQKAKKSEPDGEGTLIEKQNRLIENQNEFISYLLQSEQQPDDAKRSAPNDSIDYLYYHRFPKGDVPDSEAREDSLREVREGELKQARDSLLQASARDTVLSKVSPEEGEIVRYINSDSSGVGEADTLYVYREADSLAYGADVSADSAQAFSADSTLTTDSITRPPKMIMDTIYRSGENQKQNSDTASAKAFFADTLRNSDSTSTQPRMVTDTIYMIKEVPEEKPGSEKSSSSDESILEERMEELESENAELREAVEEAKNAEPRNTETKTNTITKRVTEREGEKSRNTIIPVPLPFGGKNKDQKEVLENQKQMEGQIDSLEAKIDRMQKGPTPSSQAQVDSSNIEYIVTPSYSYSQMPAGEEAFSDSTSTDTLSISGPTQSYGLETRLNSLPESHFIAPLFRMPLTKVDVQSENLMQNPDTPDKQVSTEASRADLQDDPKSRENTKTTEESKDETGNAPKYTASYPVKVLFGLNRHELPQAYTDQLDQVVRDLKANDGAEVVITGYTDKSGDAEYNRSLSEKRANGVKNYLIGKGVPDKSISVKAAGNEKATEAYNKEMRKVEVSLSR